MNRLNNFELMEADSNASDDDLRRAVAALAEIEACSPSLKADFFAAVNDAIRSQWWRERLIEWATVEQINDIARELVIIFDCPMEQAQRIAKERVTGTRRTAMFVTLDLYMELARQESEKRRERDRINNPPPMAIGYLPPEESPIVITTAREVPGAVKLVQERRAAS